MINDLDMVQWAYLLDPCFELTNSEGKPLTGGWMEIYQHGTRNKVYTASDFDGTLHPFRIPLDSLGANIVLVTPEYTYDVYVYNRFGTLVMSRYNVTPVGVGSDVSVTGITELTSDGTLEVSVSGGVYVISAQEIWDALESVSSYVDNVSAYVDTVSATLRNDIETVSSNMQAEIETVSSNLHNEVASVSTNLESEIQTVSGSLDDLRETVSGLSGDMASVSAALSGKKDIQTPYSASGTRLQTITSVTQDDQGVVHVEYSDIQAQNPLVPGDYISIDSDVISVTGLPSYSEVSEMIDDAVSAVTGSLPEEQELVAGQYVDLEVSGNTVTVNVTGLQPAGNYATEEYVDEAVSSVTAMFPEEQELVAGDNITITVSGASAIISASGGGSTYIAGEYVSISNDVISVTGLAPQVNSDWNAVSGVSEILNKPSEKYLEAGSYITITETASAVTIAASGLQPAGNYAAESELQAVSAAIPSLSGYATEAYVDAAVSSVTGLFPEEQELVAGEGISINVSGSSAIISASCTLPEEQELIAGEGINITVSGASAIISASGGSFTQVNSDWEAVSGVAEILNKPEQISIVPGDNMDISVTGASAIISFDPEVTDLVAGDNVSITVSGTSAIISASGGGAPQVNSDWTATSGVAEILNKPDIVPLVAGSNVTITDATTGIVISSSGGGSTYTAGSYIDISNDTISVTGIDPQVQSDWNQTVSSSVDYIKNKPEVVDMGVVAVSAGSGITLDEVSGTLFISCTGNVIEEQELVAGDNITITVSGASAVIAASVPTVTGYASEEDLMTVSAAVSGIQPQANSDWNAVSGVTEILNKPTQGTLAAGNGIEIDLQQNNVIEIGTTIDMLAYNESIAISGGQFVGGATYSFNKYIPVGQKFCGTLSIKNLHSSDSGAYMFELKTNGNHLFCNFGDYTAYRQGGHVIPMYVDNTGGSAPVQLYFTLSGQFDAQTLDCRIYGITIG